jgi:CRP/FNR family cyclic AMP-dependent transcriptional regulator
MATNPALAVPQQLEDPLVYLSSSSILEYQKGQTIYSHNQPSTNVFLVIEGTVKVCRMADESRPVVVDIYQNEEFFGESALLNSPRRD